ncbi:MAG: DUF4252 domain-containing protein [Gammaproteobacteria bacterium]
MPLRSRVIALTAALCLALPVAALAADPQLRLPAFPNLERVASNSVNLSMGRAPLALAALVLGTQDADTAEVQDLLRSLKSVSVRSYEFAADNMYSAADVDQVREQLSAPGWNALARIKQQQMPEAENVDVYVSTGNDDQINGIAVVAQGARRFTIVNIVGPIDAAKLAKLQGHFGLPSLSM